MTDTTQTITQTQPAIVARCRWVHPGHGWICVLPWWHRGEHFLRPSARQEAP